MGLLTGLGTLLGFVNSNDTASNLAKDISSGVDKMFYTQEEKAENTIKAYDAWLRMVETLKSAETYRSITRRILAVFIIFNLICMIWLCIFSEIAGIQGWFGLTILTVDDVSFTPVTWAILKLASVFELGWVFCTIIVFYFGPHMIQFFKGNK